MRISPKDWVQCSESQKTKIYDLRKLRAIVSATNVAVSNSAVQPQTLLSTPPAHTPHIVSDQYNAFYHLL
jgi:hypothetical protein